ncbi:MAG TPA: sugar ABC transporter ATP-binding protein [Flexilinea sp.]|nr:sugar ABC transporter ATP-binding protein [Flexilinea sp.]HPR71619.1 sugar ABC transporter ATP-binding protein [Flexilinea sp.]HQF36904.1 sugar ABC transporter ATP-binding protein [Candidatus Dojkabacteria bacterium]
MEGPILQLESISKSFGGVKALQNVSLELYKGEILSIIGENGAGKSTLMKIIAGALKADNGKIFFEGNLIKFLSPLDATKKGISIVFQEPNIFSDMSVLENIFCGNEIKKKNGSLDWDEMYNQGSQALEMVGLPQEILSLSMKELSIGNQQLVLIARGIFRKCKILILDEPTSILSYTESEKLFSIIFSLKKEGVSILYISHRIPEILRISDNIIILRDGIVTGKMKPEEADETKIITAMSGRKINQGVYESRDYQKNNINLQICDLNYSHIYENISFDVRPGEILGFYGLVGSGRSEIARAIFGETLAQSGKIFFNNKDVTKLSIKEKVKKRIFYVPEDRGTQGLFYDHSITENMSVPFLDDLSNKYGFIKKGEERKIVQLNIEKYKIKTPSQDEIINNLSGGSQQKVLFCRWLLKEPNVLILDEPTRGIDVMTKSEIHKYIMDLAMKNVAIILISSDLPEILELSDEIITIHNGKITGHFNRNEADEETILKYSLGLIEQTL